MVGTKTDALRIVFSAVRVYTDNLLGRSLLFVCKRKSDGEIYYFEASFDASNFKHLTGFVSSISPGHFYDMCMDIQQLVHMLTSSMNHQEASDNYPLQWIVMKPALRPVRLN